jgi:hypothetical protein
MRVTYTVPIYLRYCSFAVSLSKTVCEVNYEINTDVYYCIGMPIAKANVEEIYRVSIFRTGLPRDRLHGKYKRCRFAGKVDGIEV